MDVVITGVGVVAPLGHTPGELMDGLLEGRSAVAPVTHFDTTPFPCTVSARVTDFKARDWVKTRKNLKLMSDAVRFGLGAVKRAYQDAAPEGIPPERLGIFVGAGTAFGKTEDLVPALEASIDGEGVFDSSLFGTEGMHAINPLWLLKGLSNNVLGFASADLDARGMNQNYCNSGVSGLQAIGEAAWAIEEGTADVILAGGADSAANPEHFTGFGRLNMLSAREGSDAAKPFDLRRDGFVPGEGAAFVCLEAGEAAKARGAHIHARLAGYGNACGANTLPNGCPQAIASACRAALRVAGWRPEQVDVIYAHASATQAFDKAEAEGLARVFGAQTPPVTTPKAQIGHALAAAGALAVACAIEGARRGVIPAIAHLEKPDPATSGLDLVREARHTPIRRALVHAAGLGAQTTFIALEFDAPQENA